MKAALELLVALIMRFEGCELRAYPDPASPLSRALSARGLLSAYKRGQVVIPADLRSLSGAPWTCGWGETAGVTEGMVWTQEYADSRLRARAAEFLLGVYQRAPMLYLEPSERAAACGSLAYNIGLGAFNASTVKRKTNEAEWEAGAAAFLLWNKSGGRVMAGLTNRRKAESTTYLV